MVENALVFQFEHLRELTAKFGRIPSSETDNHAIYPAASFAAQVLSILEVSRYRDVGCRPLGAYCNCPFRASGMGKGSTAIPSSIRDSVWAREAWPQMPRSLVSP